MDNERPEDGDHVDTLKLRFIGEDDDGNPLHELRASHVAEVLQGIVGLASDFEKAGAFGEGLPAEVLVRPAREGSFIIEVIRLMEDYPVTSAAVGSVGSGIGTVLWWATKSMRAKPRDIEYLDNGNVKITWQDDTVEEVPAAAWAELNKRSPRHKKQLRQILAPLSDPNVSSVEVSDQDAPGDASDVPAEDAAPDVYVLTRQDYDAVRPEDDISESFTVFETEAQMSAIDFEDPEKWRVKTVQASRLATVEDEDFLLRVDRGLAIHKGDIFSLKIREDQTVKNGRTTRKWTVLQVLSHRRSAGDDDGS